MERLSPLDATFLHVEDAVSHMHLGSVGVFAGPPPAHDALVAAVAARLHRAPRLRQKVRCLPLDAARPVWVDDPCFDLGYHVRRTALPAPGSDAQLRRLVGRVMGQQLDRDRPLWEMWAVEGLAGGRWAVVSKLHHAMVDGISSSNLVTSLMDLVPDPPAEPAPAWCPAPEPSTAELLAGAVRDRAASPGREARAVAAALGSPRTTLRHGATVARGLAAYAGLLRAPAATELNGAIGRSRRWACAGASMDDVRIVRRAHGGTVNDVVLAAVAGAFRTLFELRGEPVPDRVRTLVPVSVRARDGDGAPCNKVSAIFAALPVAVADPVERLARVREEMAALKATGEPVAGEQLTAWAFGVPEVVLDLAGRLATRAPQHRVTTVTTNVPGPQLPLFLAGRRMLEAYPYVPLGGHVRMGVAIYSYDGRLGFGVTGDYDTAPDVGVLATGIADALGELVRRSRTGSASSRPVLTAAGC